MSSMIGATKIVEASEILFLEHRGIVMEVGALEDGMFGSILIGLIDTEVPEFMWIPQELVTCNGTTNLLVYFWLLFTFNPGNS